MSLREWEGERGGKVQRMNSDRRKTRIQSTIWNRRKKETSNQKRMKKQEFRKMRRGLGISRTL